VTNIDDRTVAGFGDEWTSFDQSGLSRAEQEHIFGQYFSIMPWDRLPPNAVGFDLGCGSGRWAELVAPRVGTLHCIDASGAALNVARRKLAQHKNCVFHEASVDAIPLADDSMDFAYSLGVLHHVPSTAEGIRDCVRKLKPGAPFLIYLYYAFDNRPGWFRAVWRASDLGRRAIRGLPYPIRYGASQAIAACVYYPLARGSLALEKMGYDVNNIPLAQYRERSFYVMRNDALDRFGTMLEQRFTRAEISAMMTAAGLRDIAFSDAIPYWCAIGIKA